AARRARGERGLSSGDAAPGRLLRSEPAWPGALARVPGAARVVVGEALRHGRVPDRDRRETRARPRRCPPRGGVAGYRDGRTARAVSLRLPPHLAGSEPRR